MLDKVFVYGTLLTGEGNWGWSLAPQEGVKDSLSGAKIYSLGGFPGMIHDEDEASLVHGEIFTITEELLQQLDRLEGYREDAPIGSMYIREEIVTVGGVKAYTYFFNAQADRLKSSKLIESGDWLNRE